MSCIATFRLYSFKARRYMLRVNTALAISSIPFLAYYSAYAISYQQIELYNLLSPLSNDDDSKFIQQSAQSLLVNGIGLGIQCGLLIIWIIIAKFTFGWYFIKPNRLILIGEISLVMTLLCLFHLIFWSPFPSINVIQRRGLKKITNNNDLDEIINEIFGQWKIAFISLFTITMIAYIINLVLCLIVFIIKEFFRQKIKRQKARRLMIALAVQKSLSIEKERDELRKERWNQFNNQQQLNNGSNNNKQNQQQLNKAYLINNYKGHDNQTIINKDKIDIRQKINDVYSTNKDNQLINLEQQRRIQDQKKANALEQEIITMILEEEMKKQYQQDEQQKNRLLGQIKAREMMREKEEIQIMKLLYDEEEALDQRIKEKEKQERNKQIQFIEQKWDNLEHQEILRNQQLEMRQKAIFDKEKARQEEREREFDLIKQQYAEKEKEEEIQKGKQNLEYREKYFKQYYDEIKMKEKRDSNTSEEMDSNSLGQTSQTTKNSSNDEEIQSIIEEQSNEQFNIYVNDQISGNEKEEKKEEEERIQEQKLKLQRIEEWAKENIRLSKLEQEREKERKRDQEILDEIQQDRQRQLQKQKVLQDQLEKEEQELREIELQQRKKDQQFQSSQQQQQQQNNNNVQQEDLQIQQMDPDEESKMKIRQYQWRMREIQIQREIEIFGMPLLQRLEMDQIFDQSQLQQSQSQQNQQIINIAQSPSLSHLSISPSNQQNKINSIVKSSQSPQLLQTSPLHLQYNGLRTYKQGKRTVIDIDNEIAQRSISPLHTIGQVTQQGNLFQIIKGTKLEKEMNNMNININPNPEILEEWVKEKNYHILVCFFISSTILAMTLFIITALIGIISLLSFGKMPTINIELNPSKSLEIQNKGISQYLSQSKSSLISISSQPFITYSSKLSSNNSFPSSIPENQQYGDSSQLNTTEYLQSVSNYTQQICSSSQQYQRNIQYDCYQDLSNYHKVMKIYNYNAIFHVVFAFIYLGFTIILTLIILICEVIPHTYKLVNKRKKEKQKLLDIIEDEVKKQNIVYNASSTQTEPVQHPILGQQCSGLEVQKKISPPRRKIRTKTNHSQTPNASLSTSQIIPTEIQSSLSLRVFNIPMNIENTDELEQSSK